jgi:hypothetical protein
MLTDADEQVCRTMGIKEADFEAYLRRQDSEARMTVTRVSTGAQGAGLDDAGKAVCRQLGLGEAEFVAYRRRHFEKEIMRRAGDGRVATRTATLSRGAFIARDVLDEQLKALKGSVTDDNAEISDLIAAAEKEIAAYETAAAAGDDDAYQRLGCAAAILVVALDKISPAWATRHPEAAAGEHKEARDRGRDGVQSPFGDRTEAVARGSRARIAYGRIGAPSRDA